MADYTKLAQKLLDEIKQAKLKDDPVAWALSRFPNANDGQGIRLWPMQAEILRSIVNNKRTIVRACHASSKSYTSALATIYWVEKYGTDGLVVTTAPTDDQVVTVIWKEINLRAIDAIPPLPGRILTKEWKFGKPGLENIPVAFGRATKDANAFQGRHAKHVLVIVDEGAGIEPAIWDGIKATLTVGHTRLLVIGNPTEVSGGFYDLANNPSVGTKVFHINAFLTPNYLEANINYVEPPEDEVGQQIWRVNMLQQLEPYALQEEWNWPGLNTPKVAYETLSEYPVSDPFVQARLFGNFPSFSETAIIPMQWIVSSQRKWQEVPKLEETPIAMPMAEIGIDPALQGDAECTIAVRAGNYVLKIFHRAMSSPKDIEQDLKDAITYANDLGFEVASIRLDTAGMGQPIYQYMMYSEYPWPTIYPINAGASPQDKTRFANLRAEMWFKMRELLDPALGDSTVILPKDEKLASQLAAPKYKLNMTRKIVVEDKRELRARGMKDLGRADAVILSCLPLDAITYLGKMRSPNSQIIVPSINIYGR